MVDDSLNEPSNAREAADMLMALLELQQERPFRWRGRRRPSGVGRIFGGQVIAQAVAAAQRSVDDDRLIHSLHAYFLRGGDEDHPIHYTVEADLDGGSFSNRRVVATQNGRPILTFAASFQRPEPGLSHSAPMPQVPGPDELPDHSASIDECLQALPHAARLLMSSSSPIEFRPVSLMPFLQSEPVEAVANTWFRLAAPIEAPLAMHQAILAYASDFAMISTALLPHAVHTVRDRLQGASVDHAMWFHAPVRADEWLLYHTRSPWSGQARGLSIGSIYTAAGQLVATTAQEGLMRVVSPRST